MVSLILAILISYFNQLIFLFSNLVFMSFTRMFLLKNCYMTSFVLILWNYPCEYIIYMFYVIPIFFFCHITIFDRNNNQKLNSKKNQFCE